MNEDDKSDLIVEWCARIAFALFVALVIFLLSMLFSGCTRTVYVPQTSIQRDSIYIAQYKRDSIYMRDSVFLTQKNDTVFMEKWHTKYIEKLSTDTLYIERNDTIREPYPVEKPISTVSKMWMNLGKFSAGAGLCAIFVGLIYVVSFKKR